MSDDIVPSFYDTYSVNDLEVPSLSNNFQLRPGEVVEIIRPEDDKSKTGKFVEYDVLVQHVEHNGVVTKLYHNCLLLNPLMGAADQAKFLLRSDRGKNRDDKNLKLTDGVGSRVLMLCINGDQSNAIIMGGLRSGVTDDKDIPDDALAHFSFNYNGIDVQIADDGSLKVEHKGATNADGTTRDGVDENGVGTKVEMKADGSFLVETKDAEERISLDHANGKLTVHANQIHIGNDAGEAAVLGDTLIAILEELLDAMLQESHGTAVGPSSPPLNAAQYAAVRAKLRTALSGFTFVKKNP